MATYESAVDKVINALDSKGCKVKQAKNGKCDYYAHCPSHNDSNASLAITQGRDGRALLKCFAGCMTEQIVDALGLQMTDLFPDDGGGEVGKPEPKPVKPDKPFWYDEANYDIQKTYDYVDEDGSLLFQALRLVDKITGDKTFRQRKPDGKGGWLSGVSGVRRVLYNLPDVINAVETNQPIYIVEGEKCVERLIDENLVATCNPMGAGKWDNGYTESLKGADVIIIPDNDKPGEDHSQLVAKSVAYKAKSVKIVHLFGINGIGEKADIYDWLEVGHTIDELQELVDKAEVIEPDINLFTMIDEPEPVKTKGISAGALLEKVFTEIKWVVKGLISQGITIISARPKTGKSFAMMEVAIAVATGGKVFGEIQVDKGKVLYLALEDSERRLQSRLRKLLDGNKSDDLDENLIFIDASTGWKRLDNGGLQDLEQFIDENPDLKLIVIDTLQKVKPIGRGGVNQYENDYAALSGVHKMAIDKSVGIVLVHHTRKSESLSGDVFDEVSGSLGLTGVADTNIIIKRPRNSEDAVLTMTSRDAGEQEWAMRFDPLTCKWTIIGEASEVGKASVRQQIMDIFRKVSTPIDAQELQGGLTENGVDLKPATIRWYLRALAEDKEIRNESRGKYIINNNVNVNVNDIIYTTDTLYQQTNKQTSMTCNTCNTCPDNVGMLVCWSVGQGADNDADNINININDNDWLNEPNEPVTLLA